MSDFSIPDIETVRGVDGYDHRVVIQLVRIGGGVVAMYLGVVDAELTPQATFDLIEATAAKVEAIVVDAIDAALK